MLVLNIPKEIRKVSVIFMFLDQEGLAPRSFPPDEVMPVTMTQPGGKQLPSRESLDKKSSRFKVVARYGNSNRYRTDRMSEELLEQDFALAALWHGSRERESGEIEFGCKFIFSRDADPQYRYEIKRLKDFDRLTKGMQWKCSVEAGEDQIRMLFFSPRIVDEPLRACA